MSILFFATIIGAIVIAYNLTKQIVIAIEETNRKLDLLIVLQKDHTSRKLSVINSHII
jgi:hypothetical protein